MNERYVIYFEVTYKNTVAGYTCGKNHSTYKETLERLAAEYPDLELGYREWSDGTVEDGLIEKEDW